MSAPRREFEESVKSVIFWLFVIYFVVIPGISCGCFPGL